MTQYDPKTLALLTRWWYGNPTGDLTDLTKALNPSSKASFIVLV